MNSEADKEYLSLDQIREQQLDRLAQVLSDHLDLDKLNQVCHTRLFQKLAIADGTDRV